MRLFKYWSLLVLFLAGSTNAQEHDLEFSLLTCTNGDQLYSAFGHSAIRVKDFKNDEDQVFDYGIFDFNTEFFLAKFLTGELKYKLSTKSYGTFIKTYLKEERGISEQVFNFSPETEAELYQKLVENYKIENRYYQYDFLKDNCSTRIRDIIKSLESVGSIDGTTAGRTYRQYMHDYLDHSPWIKLGIDLIMGSAADEVPLHHNHMFLPNKLSEKIGDHGIENGTNSRTMLQDPVVLIEPGKAGITAAFIHPFVLFTPLFFIVGGLFFLKQSALRYFRIPFYSIVGLMGVLMVLLWLGSRHEAFSFNWNILWANPLLLLAVFIRAPKFRRIFSQAVAGISTLFILLWFIIPQGLNTSVIPIIGILIFLSLRDYMALRTEEPKST